MVNESGSNLQGYAADDSGTIGTALGNLQITNALLAQKPTTEIVFNGNLDARADAPTVAPFDPTDPDTYNFTSTTTVYDSAGSAHQVTMYFAKDPVAANQYNISVTIDDVVKPETSPSCLITRAFSTLRQRQPLTSQVTRLLTPMRRRLTSICLTSLAMVRTRPARFTQDGYAAGSLAGFEFDRQGIAYATYTNGETRAVGQVALATFTNARRTSVCRKNQFC